jgi:hypothetical protein
MKRFLFLVCLGLPAISWAEPKPVPPSAAPKPYPLAVCLIEDAKLGEHGEPLVFTYRDRELKVCCKMCKRAFLKNPEHYLRKLETPPAPPPAPSRNPAS